MAEFTIAGVEGGVCAPRAFRATGVAAGLVALPAGAEPDAGPGAAPATVERLPDVGLVVSQHPASAAGRFTAHHFPSAPVRWSRSHVPSESARAVLVHAGSANAATGQAGDDDAAALAAACASELGCEPADVLLLATGRVGTRVDLAAALEGVEHAAGAVVRRGSADVARAVAASGGIAREQAVAVAWPEGEVRIGAVAKASAPFAPSFATTLCILTTDASCPALTLGDILTRAVARSFERVLVDDGPSAADAVVILANGAAAAPALRAGSEGAIAFEAGLGQLCESLAEQLVMRVRGARRLLAVTVCGAPGHPQALAVARAVAGSTALRVRLAAGQVPWPEVLDALGAADVEFSPWNVQVRVGPVTVVGDGHATPHDDSAAAAVVAKAEVDLTVDLGAGESAATVTTTDLPPESLERLVAGT